MFGRLEKPRGFVRALPRLEPLEDRNCPAIIDTGLLTNTAILNADPSSNTIVAQVTSSQVSQQVAAQDSARLSQNVALGSAVLNDTAATTVAAQNVQNFNGTPDSVSRFLLQIDPMTPVQTTPQTVQSQYLPVATTNVGNVGPNTLQRVTSTTVGGSGGSTTIIPEVMAPWVGLSADGAPQGTVRPAATDPDSPPRPQMINPAPAEDPTPDQAAPRQEEEQTPHIAPLPPAEAPSDEVGLAFRRFHAPVVPVSPSFYGVEMAEFVTADPAGVGGNLA